LKTDYIKVHKKNKRTKNSSSTEADIGLNLPVNSSTNDVFRIDSYVSGSTSTASSQRVLAPNFAAQHLQQSSTRQKREENFLTNQNTKSSSKIENELYRLNIELDKHRSKEIELYNDNEKFQKLVEHYKRANQVNLKSLF